MKDSKRKALEAIKALYSEVPHLKLLKEDDEACRVWKHKVDNIIKQIYGDKSSEHRDIHGCLFPVLGPPRRTPVDYHQEHLRRLDTLSIKLQGFASAIELLDDDESNNDSDAIKTLTQILSRFHKFVCQLRNRYDKRTPIEVKDEYDVQYLLHAILKLHFDDVRSEENLPSYAGSSSRVDFALKKEKILIEVKMTRENLKDKELVKQLVIDKAHYKTNTDYNTLVCFIYDPKGLIDNRCAIEEDLSESNKDLNVNIVIAP